ncbi:hypothetical protein [Aliivibrio sifiae]|uniref:hypothetical protein n=1 Tax=Aliivibrio sifiae TaxID=566293 RepID=UPI003D0EA302
MNNKLTLSIVMTSVIAFNSGMVSAVEEAVVAQASSGNGGHCAAGKCGTEKRFGKADLKGDPQGRLVRARDGKCGLSGEGVNAPAVITDKSKITGGLCGQ